MPHWLAAAMQRCCPFRLRVLLLVLDHQFEAWFACKTSDSLLQADALAISDLVLCWNKANECQKLFLYFIWTQVSANVLFVLLRFYCQCCVVCRF